MFLMEFKKEIHLVYPRNVDNVILLKQLVQSLLIKKKTVLLAPNNLNVKASLLVEYLQIIENLKRKNEVV